LRAVPPTDRVIVDEPLSLCHADRRVHSRLRDHFAACDAMLKDNTNKNISDD